MPVQRSHTTAGRRRGARTPFAIAGPMARAQRHDIDPLVLAPRPGHARLDALDPVQDVPDLGMIQAMFDGQARIEIVGLLVATMRTELARLAQADATGDRTVAVQALHRLLGSLCLLGPMPLLDDGRRLLEAMRAAGERPGPAVPPRMLQRLHALADRLEAPAH